MLKRMRVELGTARFGTHGILVAGRQTSTRLGVTESCFGRPPPTPLTPKSGSRRDSSAPNGAFDPISATRRPHSEDDTGFGADSPPRSDSVSHRRIFDVRGRLSARLRTTRSPSSNPSVTSDRSAVTCPSLTSRRSRPSSWTTKQKSWPFSTRTASDGTASTSSSRGIAISTSAVMPGLSPAGHVFQLDDPLEISDVRSPVECGHGRDLGDMAFDPTVAQSFDLNRGTHAGIDLVDDRLVQHRHDFHVAQVRQVKELLTLAHGQARAR